MDISRFLVKSNLLEENSAWLGLLVFASPIALVWLRQLYSVNLSPQNKINEKEFGNNAFFQAAR